MLDPSIERWKKYLRFDPTRWLLEANDPSILLWYQMDIAHRPEDAPGVLQTRDRVLYSDAVQEIFSAQDHPGFWGNAESLAQPYYTATLWNLALMAELGIPRTSRRAHNGCEFVLQNFLHADGTFKGLNAIETGYLLRALGYFKYAEDVRALRAASALGERVDSYQTRVCALWGWRAFLNDSEIAKAAQEHLEHLLEECAEQADTLVNIPYTFPPFEPRDSLFVLRVLTEYDRVNDTRAAPLIQALVAKQNAKAQWGDAAGEPSRWITLNALRVIVKLVLNEK